MRRSSVTFVRMFSVNASFGPRIVISFCGAPTGRDTKPRVSQRIASVSPSTSTAVRPSVTASATDCQSDLRSVSAVVSTLSARYAILPRFGTSSACALWHGRRMKSPIFVSSAMPLRLTASACTRMPMRNGVQMRSVFSSP